jgi:hypothetical protein
VRKIMENAKREHDKTNGDRLTDDKLKTTCTVRRYMYCSLNVSMTHPHSCRLDVTPPTPPTEYHVQ